MSTVRAGVIGATGLAAFYALVVGFAGGLEHLGQQTAEDWPWLVLIIGGFGNVEGTIIAGLAVGLIESYATQLVNPGLTDLIVFALLLLMLAFRPTGLIAERREENV